MLWLNNLKNKMPKYQNLDILHIYKSLKWMISQIMCKGILIIIMISCFALKNIIKIYQLVSNLIAIIIAVVSISQSWMQF